MYQLQQCNKSKSVKIISFYKSFCSEETKGNKKQRKLRGIDSTPLNFLVYLVSAFSSQVSQTWFVFLTFEDKFILSFSVRVVSPSETIFHPFLPSVSSKDIYTIEKGTHLSPTNLKLTATGCFTFQKSV